MIIVKGHQQFMNYSEISCQETVRDSEHSMAIYCTVQKTSVENSQMKTRITLKKEDFILVVFK